MRSRLKSKIVPRSPQERFSEFEFTVWKRESSPIRPVIFKNEEWDKKKKLYIQSVTNHTNEKPGVIQDVMSELLNLITKVSEKIPFEGVQWQHPADFTRRNYQSRFRTTTPTITLSEWQEKSQATYQRFAHVPKVFKRSHKKMREKHYYMS